MGYFKIEGRPDIRKDPKNGSVLNVDKEKVNDYLAKKKSIADSLELHSKVETLESDITEIKNMLKALLDK